MNQQNANLICHVCQKSFSSVSTKNRHLKTVHHATVERKPKNNVHIQCPICIEQEKRSFRSHDLLQSHLENIHSLNIKTFFHNFRTMEEFETWRALISRNVDYVVNSTHITESSKTKWIYYNCNRSNYKGFVSQCSQRSMKKGGSIRISGMCPSRICVKICGSEITVKFVETHVGHGDKLPAKHLTECQQQMIANKLIAGESKDKNIHAVTSVEKNGDPVVGIKIEEEEYSNLCIAEPLSDRTQYENDVRNFIVENERQSPNVSTDPSRKGEITKERACMLVNLLNDDNLDKFTRMLEKAYKEQTKSESDCKKRKIDKQLYYPSKK